MKKALIKNALLHIPIVAAYCVFFYLNSFARTYFMYTILLISLIVPWLLIGASLFFLDLSNRICNAIFLVINMICVVLYFFVFFQIEIMLYASIIISITFLLGTIIPKKKPVK